MRPRPVPESVAKTWAIALHPEKERKKERKKERSRNFGENKGKAGSQPSSASFQEAEDRKV